MAPTPPPTIDDLGVRGCLYLAALLGAQERRLPVAPTLRSTAIVMDLLRELGLIEVPWPEPRWEVRPDAEETPIERLQWKFIWDTHQRDGLLVSLEEYLQSIPRDDYGLGLRLQLWEELAVAEAERFFEQQLTKHHFEASWARDLAFVHRDTHPALSIGQWRYCCWAATRHGGSVAQQQRTPDMNAIREAIYAELRRRVGYVGNGTWTNCSFPPSQPKPESALGRAYTTHLTRFGPSFWTAPPATLDLFQSS